MNVELYILNRLDQLERIKSRLDPEEKNPSDPSYASIQCSILELLKVLDFIQK